VGVGVCVCGRGGNSSTYGDVIEGSYAHRY